MTTAPFENTIDTLFEGVKSLHKPQKVKAIWTNRPVITSAGRKSRLEKGMQLYIENGELKDCKGMLTHEIIECRGTYNSNFSLVLKNLNTGELSILLL